MRWLALLLFFFTSAWAAEVKLAWNPNSEPDLAGYRIHYGTASGSYTSHVDVGNVTTYTVPGLADGVRYYFAATAYNATDESGYSNEVNWASGEPAPYIGATALIASRYQVEEQQKMSVTRVGSVTYIESNSETGSQSVTVPTCDFMIVGAGGYGGTTMFSGATMTIGGNSMTRRASAPDNGGQMTVFFEYANPPAGSQTLAWDLVGGPGEGVVYWIAFYSGVANSSGYLQAFAWESDSQGPLTANSGDAIIVIINAYTSGTLTLTNLTSAGSRYYREDQVVFAEAFPSGNITIEASVSGAGLGWSIMRLVQSTGGASAVPAVLLKRLKPRRE